MTEDFLTEEGTKYINRKTYKGCGRPKKTDYLTFGELLINDCFNSSSLLMKVIWDSAAKDKKNLI